MYTGTLAPFSNREDWIITGTLVDEDTGSDVDLTGADLFFYVTKQNCPDSAELTATDGDGITYPTSTSYQIAFTDDDVSDICPGTYSVFLRVTIAGVTTQVMAATVECKHGGPENG